MMFFNLAKILPTNLGVVIIFKEQISKLYILAAKLLRTNIQTVHFGSEAIKILGAKTWDLIPAEIKASNSLMIFKKKIKNSTPKSCPCRFCRIYISQDGFIN